jgi:hypothetical protein
MRKFDKLIRFTFLDFRAVKNLSHFIAIKMQQASQLTLAVETALPSLSREQRESWWNEALRFGRV